jgi:hypothetical protein
MGGSGWVFRQVEVTAECAGVISRRRFMGALYEWRTIRSDVQAASQRTLSYERQRPLSFTRQAGKLKQISSFRIIPTTAPRHIESSSDRLAPGRLRPK